MSFPSALQHNAIISTKGWKRDNKILTHRSRRKAQTIAALSNLCARMVYQIGSSEIWFMYKAHDVLFWWLLHWNNNVNMLYKMFWSLKIKKPWHLLCVANTHACWNRHISLSYGTLYMQFFLSKEFHFMDVLSTTLLQQSTFRNYFPDFSTYFERTLFWYVYVLHISLNLA